MELAPLCEFIPNAENTWNIVPPRGRHRDFTNNSLLLLDGGCLDSRAENSEDQGKMVCGHLVTADKVTEEEIDTYMPQTCHSRIQKFWVFLGMSQK